MNIGAAWPRRSGEKGLSVKLTVIPVQFDGRFVLLPPLPAEIDDLARLHQLRGLGDAKVLKSLGRSSKGRHYRG